MSLERALAPLAVAVAVIALAVWLMLVNDVGIGPWLLALLVFTHGWVHLLFVFPKPTDPGDALAGSGYPFDFARSWLITRQGLGLGLVKRIGIVAMAVTFVLATLAALSTVGLLIPVEAWAALLVATAIASTVMLTLFFSSALILGFVNNALMVLLVVSGSWSPA
jgi:hypothetical protein